jgi:hypothetical protein
MEVLPPYPTPLFDQDCLQAGSSGGLQQTTVTFKLISESASLLPVSTNCAVTCLVRDDDFLNDRIDRNIVSCFHLSLLQGWLHGKTTCFILSLLNNFHYIGPTASFTSCEQLPQNLVRMRATWMKNE